MCAFKLTHEANYARHFIFRIASVITLEMRFLSERGSRNSKENKGACMEKSAVNLNRKMSTGISEDM